MTQKVKLSGFFCDYSTGECFQIEIDNNRVKDVNTRPTKSDIHEH